MIHRFTQMRLLAARMNMTLTMVPWHLLLMAAAIWLDMAWVAFALAAFDICLMAVTIDLHRSADDLGRDCRWPLHPRTKRLARLRLL